MKGIVCEEIERFAPVELQEPAYTDGEAIVAIKRIGICGTDYHAYKGRQPFFTYPRMLGHELSGVIERIGGNAEGLREGDIVSVVPYLNCGACIACRNGKPNCCTSLSVLGVHIDGGMRERLSIPTRLLLKADGLTLDQAAVLEPLAIGAHALRRSGLRRGDTALVIGGGPIGLGVMALAGYIGATVIAMDVNEERLAFSRGWAGVAHTVHVAQQPEEQLAALTNGELPPFVFDATGSAASMNGAFRYVAHGGTLVFVGLFKGDVQFHDPEFHKRETTLMASRNATREDFELVMRAMRAGSVDAARYITHRAPFDGMIAAFGEWLKPESGVIKAMVEL